MRYMDIKKILNKKMVVIGVLVAFITTGTLECRLCYCFKLNFFTFVCHFRQLYLLKTITANKSIKYIIP